MQVATPDSRHREGYRSRQQEGNNSFYQESIYIALLALQPNRLATVTTTAAAAAAWGEGLPFAELLTEEQKAWVTQAHTFVSYKSCRLSQHPCIHPADNGAVIRKRTEQAGACGNYPAIATEKYAHACLNNLPEPAYLVEKTFRSMAQHPQASCR